MVTVGQQQMARRACSWQAIVVNVCIALRQSRTLSWLPTVRDSVDIASRLRQPSVNKCTCTCCAACSSGTASSRRAAARSAPASRGAGAGRAPPDRAPAARAAHACALPARQQRTASRLRLPSVNKLDYTTGPGDQSGLLFRFVFQSCFVFLFLLDSQSSTSNKSKLSSIMSIPVRECVMLSRLRHSADLEALSVDERE